MRIGVISIARRIEGPQSWDFDRLYQAIGLNTGNFMFTQAVFRDIAGDLEQIGFNFSPADVNKRFSHVVVPAANWLNEEGDWDWLIDRIEQLEIPVVTIGLGLQAATVDRDAVKVSPSAERLARVLARKAPFLSTRGIFTRDWLHSIGIDNAVATGCPSLYMKILPETECGTGQCDGFVVQSTRYDVAECYLNGPSLNRDLFSYAAKYDAWMVYQSEPEEIRYLVYGKDFVFSSGLHGDRLASLYGFSILADLQNFLGRRGRVFFDLEDWARFLVLREGQIGTRLHGAILALNHGVPAVLLSHDSRTQEIIDFAGLPTINSDMLFKSDPSVIIHSTLISDQIGLFERRKIENRRIYVEFLRQNGLDLREKSAPVC